MKVFPVFRLMSIIFVLSIITSFFSCVVSKNNCYTKQISTYYKKSMDEYSKVSGDSIYNNLEIIEDTFLDLGVLEGKSSEDYKKLFVTLFQTDSLSFLSETLSHLITYNLLSYYHKYSKEIANEEEFTPLKAYKKLIYHSRYKYNDELLIDLLMNQTDFNDQIMRLNVLIVFLHNYQNKYSPKRENLTFPLP